MEEKGGRGGRLGVDQSKGDLMIGISRGSRDEWDGRGEWGYWVLGRGMGVLGRGMGVLGIEEGKKNPRFLYGILKQYLIRVLLAVVGSN